MQGVSAPMKLGAKKAPATTNNAASVQIKKSSVKAEAKNAPIKNKVEMVHVSNTKTKKTVKKNI